VKKTKAIMLKDLETRLSIPFDQDIIIRLPQQERDKKEYYLDHIASLKETNRKLKDIINKSSEQREQLKYLQEFCTESIRKDNCGFQDTCNERIKWDKLVKV
jgi:hypothetical protein